jgi:hypothetical protein
MKRPMRHKAPDLTTVVGAVRSFQPPPLICFVLHLL